MENITNLNQSVNYKQPKNPGITFLLNFFTISGAGFLYLGDQFTKRGIIFISVTLALGILSVITGGAALILLVPWHIMVIWSGFNATNEYNDSINIENFRISEQSQIDNKILMEIEKKNEFLSRKVKCSEFVDKIEKYSKLLKNDIISEEEFNNKKRKLINEVVLYKVAETPEDFLSVIVDLKVDGLLNQEELLKIKKAIL